MIYILLIELSHYIRYYYSLNSISCLLNAFSPADLQQQQIDED